MKTNRGGRLVLSAAMLCGAGLAAPALAQTVTATLTGAVEDRSGAAVKDAAVSAVNQKTAIEYRTRSNEAGVYTITGLPIGPYVIKAEAPGMKALATNPLTLEVGQTARVNLKLDIGTKAEEIEVVGVNPVLQTENAVVGETITGSTATALPLNGRNFAQLTLLTPGAIHHDPQSFTNPGGTSGGRPYVNGQREQGNNFMLDGIDMNEAMDNLLAYNPSPDALAEIKVETNNYSAEFGNVAGMIVNTVMKSGSNELHGNLFEFGRSDKLDANTWENNRANNPQKAKLRQDIFGGTLGGPIVKNKVFFFADYQRTQISNPNSGAVGSVAADAWRGGDFSNLGSFAPDCTRISGTQLLNPFTGAAFPCNQIPQSLFTSQARTLLADTTAYPRPNGPGFSSNYRGSQDLVTTDNQGDVKIDANLGPKDNVFFRLSRGDYDNHTNTPTYPVLMGTSSARPFWGGAFNWTRAFTSTAVNELRVGYSRTGINALFTDPAGIGDYSVKLGLRSTQPIPGLSALSFGSGLDNIGTSAPESLGTDTVYQLSDKYAFSKGRHYVSVGGQYLHYNMERSYASNSGVLGSFTFGGNAGTVGTGNGFADFLIGAVASKQLGGAQPWTQLQDRLGLYLQDDFKVDANLTVNLGLRWEYDSPLVEKDDKQANFDLATGQAQFAGAIPASADCSLVKGGCVQGSSRGLYDAYYGGFSPRLGFAWTANSKTVLRGGYGIVQYMEGTGANNRLSQNAPFVPANSAVTYTAAPGTYANGFQDVVAGAPGLVGVGQIKVFQPDLRPQLTQQWNLFAERQLSDSTSLSLGYVGSHASHLAAFHNANQALPCDGVTTDVTGGLPCPALPALEWPAATARQPENPVLPGATFVRLTASDAVANYQGIQVSLRHRRAHGLEFLASYTYSKTLGDNTGFYSAGWGATSNYLFHGKGGDGDQNFRDPGADYGPLFFDVKHNLVLSANYELPIGKGRPHELGGLAQTLLGGWNLSTIATFHSGFPITVTDGGTLRSLQPSFTNERPDRTGNGDAHQTFDWSTPGSRWLDPTAFQAAALGTFGDAGVGILRGPAYYNLDLGVDKDFTLGGTRALTLRFEAFNALNHANKGMPNPDWSDVTNFGTITYAANAPRILELAAKFRF